MRLLNDQGIDEMASTSRLLSQSQMMLSWICMQFKFLEQSHWSDVIWPALNSVC